MTDRIKVSQLGTATELTIDDIFPVSDNPSGSPISKRASMQKMVDLLEKGYFAREVDNVVDLASEDAASGYVSLVRDLNRGGIFKAVNGGTANSGTIFASATAGWTWQRVYSGWANVKWWGAVGDGVRRSVRPLLQRQPRLVLQLRCPSVPDRNLLHRERHFAPRLRGVSPSGRISMGLRARRQLRRHLLRGTRRADGRRRLRVGVIATSNKHQLRDRHLQGRESGAAHPCGSRTPRPRWF